MDNKGAEQEIRKIFFSMHSRLNAGIPRKDLESDLKARLRGIYPDAKDRFINALCDKIFDRLEGKEKILEVFSVNKSFGTNNVLSGIDLKLYRGDFIGIIGLSGSGKTTLLNIIIGFLMPDDGTVRFYERETAKQPSSATMLYGFAPQKPSFYSRLTVWENLEYFASLYYVEEVEMRKRIFSLLEFVELDKSIDKVAGTLSGGMQRRLGIACALVHDPPLVILDEPTADLDPILRRSIWNLIRKINQQGKTVILTSHFLSEVEGLCKDIAILHDHHIIASGTPAYLKEQYSVNEEIRLETMEHEYDSLIASMQHSGIAITKIFVQDMRLVIYTPEAEKALHKLIHFVEAKKYRITDIQLNKPSLIEVFESFVSKERYFT